MPSTQRIPLICSDSSRRIATALLRGLRSLELECRTREEAEGVADLVAGLLPEPDWGRLGLMELLLNAIEHGNLEIGGALKCRLVRDRCLEDEIAARLAREPYRGRRVQVRVEVAYPAIEIAIRDDGPGFAWRIALAADLDAHDGPSGRGIALVSRTCFPSLEYRDPGNIAIVKLSWPR